MVKRLYIILLISLSMLFFGCSDDASTSEIIDSSASVQTEEAEDANLSEEEIVDEKDEMATPTSDLTVHYIDASQGDATLFQYSHDNKSYTILYDTGDWKNSNVINYLEKINVQHIDLIIISHPHADHIGQLDKIMNAISVDEVWMSDNTANTNVFQKAVEAIMASDADFYEPEAGDIFDVGSMELLVLHPESLTGGLNEDSLSIRFTYGDISFVFTGDAYKNEELMMLRRDLPIQADFLQLGHHGSSTSSDPAFIEAVNPTYAIYSAGLDNEYGHPHVEVVDYFKKTDITLLGTDVHGTIKVTTDGKTYDVSTEKEGEVTSKKSTPKKNVTEPKKATKTDSNCININEASIEELKNIVHIGDVRAEELLTYRPYKSVNELTKIYGIGKGRLKDIKEQDLACVD